MRRHPFFKQNVKKLKSEEAPSTLVIKHEAGFFSCCSVALENIVNYINQYKALPAINSFGIFTMYKPDKSKDIWPDFFAPPPEVLEPLTLINFNHTHQFKLYSSLDFDNINQFFHRYFQPSERIRAITESLISKYSIDADNCIAVYYRGTDKSRETAIDSFESFYTKLLHTIKDDTTQILIQTDTAQFIEYLRTKPIYPRCIVVNELRPSFTSRGIHNERSAMENYNDISHLLAVIQIIARCQHLICSSGNVSLFIMFCRGNSLNVWQNLKRKWFA